MTMRDNYETKIITLPPLKKKKTYIVRQILKLILSVIYPLLLITTACLT